MSTKTTILTTAAASLMLVGAVASADAMTATPLPMAQGAPEVTLVSGGCGPAFHRGPFGGCRPNFYGGGYGYGYGRPWGWRGGYGGWRRGWGGRRW